jgi:hypothetical protein
LAFAIKNVLNAKSSKAPIDEKVDGTQLNFSHKTTKNDLPREILANR